MPSIGKSSSGAGIHPYLKRDFEWPEINYSEDGVLCDINDEEFLEKRIEECRKKRTFYFNERFSEILGINYDAKGQYCSLNKNVVYEMAISRWDHDHLKRWKSLKEETLTLRNIGFGWWTAETIWIKAKL